MKTPKTESKMRAIAVALLALAADPTAAVHNLVLSDKIIHLSKIAAELSNEAYNEDPSGEGYDSFSFFDDEPDQALVAKKDGYCFAAFRGTTLTAEDWAQNIKLGSADVCATNPDGSGEKECCSVRVGFNEAYATNYDKDMEQSLRECASDCPQPDECVVLTGHSQGGAIAAVAALHLPDLNPYVITFGQPPTVNMPCELVSSSRWYRFVNTKSTQFGLYYDPVPFSPKMGTEDVGHMIMLSDDFTGVAYMGLDAQMRFGPLLNGVDAHSMVSLNGTFPGYLNRIDTLITDAESNSSYPIRTNGYVASIQCTQDEECESLKCERETTFSVKRCVGTQCEVDGDCDTGRCDSGLCVPKLGSCMHCDEDSDCFFGSCAWNGRCTGENGLMDDECFCALNSECQSGRCEGITHRVCQATLPLEAHCNEGSDCTSGHCSLGFRCSSEAWWQTHPEEFDETKSKAWMKYGTIGGAVVLLAVVALWWKNKGKRQGYEQIPAHLNV